METMQIQIDHVGGKLDCKSPMGKLTPLNVKQINLKYIYIYI